MTTDREEQTNTIAALDTISSKSHTEHEESMTVWLLKPRHPVLTHAVKIVDKVWNSHGYPLTSLVHFLSFCLYNIVNVKWLVTDRHADTNTHLLSIIHYKSEICEWSPLYWHFSISARTMLRVVAGSVIAWCRLLMQIVISAGYSLHVLCHAMDWSTCTAVMR